MKPHIRSAHLALSFLLGLGISPTAWAQPADTLAALPRVQLSTEDIVTKLIQRNLERARALGAYQGTRIYRLEYHGFPGSRAAEMTVDVKYSTPGTKEFSIRSQKGSQLIIDRVFKRMLQSEKEAASEEKQSHVALNRDNYSSLWMATRARLRVWPTFFRWSRGPATNCCIAAASGWMLKTLPWSASMRSRRKILPSGPKRPGSNRFTQRWEISGSRCPIAAPVPFVWEAVHPSRLTTRITRLRPPLRSAHRARSRATGRNFETFNHQGHEGTRRKTLETKPSWYFCPAWSMRLAGRKNYQKRKTEPNAQSCRTTFSSELWTCNPPSTPPA